ncbi:laminin subunit alpha-3 [Brachyhypopomus gauderio]|uniref:laminin subunit alpha-3 n=1 Tax=Brachyhypopomus gauderio TaxID=698409 RepID=UPI004040F844
MLFGLFFSFAFGCLWVGDEFTCQCHPGYSGARCERCAAGYYGNPLEFGGNCQPCECSHDRFCDPITGQCEPPEAPGTDQDCQECDSCTQTLLDDLEAMDFEFFRLKDQLESYSESTAYLTALGKLEDAVDAVKELVIKYKMSVQALKPEVKELETDMDGVKNGLKTLNVKADLMSLAINELLIDLDTSHQLGEDLLTESGDLLKRIEELLEQLKVSNGTNAVEASRILEEAKHMVANMRRRDCQEQWRFADAEITEAQRLLDYIMKNLTGPVTDTLATAEQIGQDLMFQVSELRHLREALKKAKKMVNKTNLINDANEADVANILKHQTKFTKEHAQISTNLSMIRETLGDIINLQKMIQLLGNSYAGLAAELDGANTDMVSRLNMLLEALTKVGVVRQGEDHARGLMNLAMQFQMSLLNFTNTSVVHKAVEVIHSYSDVIEAIQEAESAANEESGEAIRASAQLKTEDLPGMVEDLKDFAKTLHDKATKTENDLKEVAQKYNAVKKRLEKGNADKKNINQELQATKQDLNNINRDDTAAVLNQTKDAVQTANSAVNNVITRLANISEGLDNITVHIGDSDMDGILNRVNKTLSELHTLLPLLPDTLAEVEGGSRLVPSRTNMSDSIMRIKDMIKESRDMVNIIRGPVLFSGDSHIELRPPTNLEDLRAFTAFDLMLRRASADPPPGDRRRRGPSRAEEDMFVLYLGNKNPQSDFVGMVVRNSVLYCIYKLGGVFHEIATTRVIESRFNSTFMDRVDFRRVYQDAEVMYTQKYNSPNPLTKPAMTNEANTTVSLLNLDPDDVVLYVGGYPSDFTPPKELRYPNYKGCIELYTLNEHILGIYNFQQAVNIKKTDQCLRVDRSEGKYLDGTGYGKINLTNRSRAVMFYVQSRQEDTILCFMGNEDSHFTVTVEGGHVVLWERQDNQTSTEKSEDKVFPTGYPRHIKIIQSSSKPKVHVAEYSVNVLVNFRAYKQAFIGGVPKVITERYNISFPPLRGCLNRLEVDVAVKFMEEVGIVPGCPTVLLGQRDAFLDAQSSLTLTPNITQSNSASMVSLGFHSTQSSGVLLHTGKKNSSLELALVSGHVELKYNGNSLKSKHTYDDGRWHHVTAFRNSTGMELNIDNSDTGAKQAAPSTTMQHKTTIILGKETFKGCIHNFYMRRLQENYIPSDLSSFSQSGVVSWDLCSAQLPLLSIPQKSSLSRRGLNPKPNPKKRGCSKPSRLIQAFYLSSRSQLQYLIPPEDLNFRPHVSLDVRTRTSTGTLLHISDKKGVSRVVLFISRGRVNLFVGEGEPIFYDKKINNGDWHNIKFSVERNTSHLVVDGYRVHDGQLKKDEGISLDLQAPIYIGAGQGKSLPWKSVTGCVRDVRFYDVLIGEPAVNHGGAPCFDGEAVDGAYFAGDGSHAILEKSFTPGAEFQLIFEARPRNMTGLLFHCRGGHGQSLSVFLKKGKMVVQANDGIGDYSASVVAPPLLCGDNFHNVTVTKKKNLLSLNVGEESRRSLGPSVGSHSKTCETLYVGGVPEHKRKKVPVWKSYVGCLRNIQINQAAVLFQSFTGVFGPINVNECPVN